MFLQAKVLCSWLIYLSIREVRCVARVAQVGHRSVRTAAEIPARRTLRISIPSNIAEGNDRISIKEHVHFLEIAYGSIMEVYCQ